MHLVFESSEKRGKKTPSSIILDLWKTVFTANLQNITMVINNIDNLVIFILLICFEH